MGSFTWRGKRFGGIQRDHWQRANLALDPATDYVEIYRNLVFHEFPWDYNQALSFALFRTYAVPGIGRLLDDTGEFGGQVQKRYDDTALLLDRPLARGFDDPSARAAIRRINQMHRSYDIPNHEMVYVLSTFVVVPVRWIADFGKRDLSDGEIEATTRYYRELGRHMGITEMPETYAGFAELMDSYEAEHFGFDAGSRRVADSTLELVLTFYPKAASAGVEMFARSMMDPPLRAALGYQAPPAPIEKASRAALKARGQLLRRFPARLDPFQTSDVRWIRSYPDGYDVADLGTHPTPGLGGCPVRHTA